MASTAWISLLVMCLHLRHLKPLDSEVFHGWHQIHCMFLESVSLLANNKLTLGEKLAFVNERLAEYKVTQRHIIRNLFILVHPVNLLTIWEVSNSGKWITRSYS